MASRYDYPSSDDTTADDFEPLTDDSEACDRGDVGTVGDYEGPLCKWCDRPLPDGETDYCDAICVIQAERDNREDR